MTAILYFCCRYGFYAWLEFLRLGRLRSALSYLPLVIIGSGLFVDSWSAFQTYFALRHALTTNSFVTVEGPIEDYRPWIPHESGELFFVHGVEFSMWDSRSQAFDDMPVPLRDGERVKISYVGNAIVRFQIEAP